MLKSSVVGTVRGLVAGAFGGEVVAIGLVKFDPAVDAHVSGYFDWESLVDSDGTPDYVGRVVLGCEDSELVDGSTIWVRSTDDGFELMYTETDLYVSQPEFYGGSVADAVAWVSEVATPVI